MVEQQYGLAWLFRLRGPLPAPDEAVIIAMDQRAADNINLLRDPGDFERCRGLEVGPRPPTHQSLLPPRSGRWPRCLHAQLVESLKAAGARVIVLDVLFRPRTPDPGPAGDVNREQDERLAERHAGGGKRPHRAGLQAHRTARWRPLRRGSAARAEPDRGRRGARGRSDALRPDRVSRRRGPRRPLLDSQELRHRHRHRRPCRCWRCRPMASTPTTNCVRCCGSMRATEAICCPRPSPRSARSSSCRRWS